MKKRASSTMELRAVSHQHGQRNEDLGIKRGIWAEPHSSFPKYCTKSTNTKARSLEHLTIQGWQDLAWEDRSAPPAKPNSKTK
jgi:hypothetical protein